MIRFIIALVLTALFAGNLEAKSCKNSCKVDLTRLKTVGVVKAKNVKTVAAKKPSYYPRGFTAGTKRDSMKSSNGWANGVRWEDVRYENVCYTSQLKRISCR